jgi:hypothetical protein
MGPERSVAQALHFSKAPTHRQKVIYFCKISLYGKTEIQSDESLVAS